MRRSLVVFMLFLCALAPVGQETSAELASVWSAPVTLGQAPQADAPALAVSGGQIVAAWVGADDRGLHQDARRLFAGELGEIVTLPLPPTHPYAQRLLPGSFGSSHLLWLDAAAEGTTNLYSAFLASDLTVERGPVSVSEGLALSYSAVEDGAGGLWLAWSGGLLAEFSVYVRRIDDEGRPLLEMTRLAENATDPALVRAADGSIWLFYIAGGALLRQRLAPAGDAPAQPLTGAISLGAGDRLIDVRAALDATTAYFFWNVTRVDGTDETWLAAGSLSAASWPQPQRLTITSDDAAQVESGFKLGKVAAASLEGDTALRWIEPASGQANTLVAAVEGDAGLGVVVLRGGQVIGYTTAVPGVRLLGLPALSVSETGAVDLAWSSPGETAANLQWITTRK